MDLDPDVGGPLTLLQGLGEVAADPREIGDEPLPAGPRQLRLPRVVKSVVGTQEQVDDRLLIGPGSRAAAGIVLQGERERPDER